MIFMTVKAKKSRNIIVLIIFLIIVFISGRIIICKSHEIIFSDKTQIADFIKNNGYNPIRESLIETTIKIPSEFNECYTEYNSIQKEQGYDLSRYKGKEAVRYRCKLDNETYVEIIVYDNKLIGADLLYMDGRGFECFIKKEN